MSYINKMVSVYGTEKDFIKGFANELTAADSRITCETDIDAEFSGEDTSHKPTIVFAVGEACKITLTRNSTITSINNGSYSFTLTVKEDNYNLYSLQYQSGGSFKDALITRAWRLKLVSNDNVLEMFLGNYNDTANTYRINIAVIFDTISCVAYSNATGILASSFITLEETSRTLKLSNRIPYSLDDQQVEIITNKTLVDSANAKVFNTQGLYDCSTIIKDSIATVDNQRCYALDEHTLIPIKE